MCCSVGVCIFEGVGTSSTLCRLASAANPVTSQTPQRSCWCLLASGDLGQVGLAPGPAGGLVWGLVLRACPGATVQTCRLGAWVHGGRPGSGVGPDGSGPLALARKGSVRRRGIMAYAWPLSPQCCTGAAGIPQCGGGSGPRPAGRAGRSEASGDFIGKPPVSSHRSIHHT